MDQILIFNWHSKVSLRSAVCYLRSISKIKEHLRSNRSFCLLVVWRVIFIDSWNDNFPTKAKLSINAAKKVGNHGRVVILAMYREAMQRLQHFLDGVRSKGPINQSLFCEGLHSEALFVDVLVGKEPTGIGSSGDMVCFYSPNFESGHGNAAVCVVNRFQPKCADLLQVRRVLVYLKFFKLFGHSLSESSSFAMLDRRWDVDFLRTRHLAWKSKWNAFLRTDALVRTLPRTSWRTLWWTSTHLVMRVVSFTPRRTIQLGLYLCIDNALKVLISIPPGSYGLSNLSNCLHRHITFLFGSCTALWKDALCSVMIPHHLCHKLGRRFLYHRSHVRKTVKGNLELGCLLHRCWPGNHVFYLPVFLTNGSIVESIKFDITTVFFVGCYRV